MRTHLLGVPAWRAAVLLLAAAAALRSWGLLTGELSWHPDEKLMVAIPLNLLSGDLNPHRFSYPGFHFYLLAVAQLLAYGTQALLGGTQDLRAWIVHRYLWSPGDALTTARWIGAIYSVATVAVTGASGRPPRRRAGRRSDGSPDAARARRLRAGGSQRPLRAPGSDRLR